MKTSKEYKLVARQRLFTKLGTLSGATAIYGLIYGAILFAILLSYSLNLLTKGVFSSVITMEDYIYKTSNSILFYIESQGIMMVVGAIMSTLSVAIMGMALKVARGQEVKFSDLLFVIKNNPDKVIIIYLIQQLLMFAAGVPANIISFYAQGIESSLVDIVFFTFMIFSYVADIYIVAMFSQAMFCYLDNPQEGALKCIELSNSVMRKHVGRYVLLVISFIPLMILASLTFGLMYLWVIPYQYTAYALFYMQLKGELGSTIDVTIE